jgi:PBP1b-binding outer membrane lipoprotein LpoB
MKLIFLLFFCILVFEGCGKKSDPEYQVKKQFNTLNTL